MSDVLPLFHFVCVWNAFFLYLCMLSCSDGQFIWEMSLFMLKIVILKMPAVTMLASSSVTLLLSFVLFAF